MKNVPCLTAGIMLCLTGSATAQPTVDGQLDPHYGPVQWLQTTPTGFGDAAPPPPCIPIGLGVRVALDNTNRLGVAGSFPVVTASQTAAGDVATGFEIRIPLAELGNPGALRIVGFVTNNNYSNFSSQAIPGIQADATAGGYPNTSAVNFQSIAGTQFVTIPLTPAGAPPSMDGQREAFYGAALAVQDTTTNYGDATAAVMGGDSIFKCPGGSEIDAIYAKVANDGNVYVLVTGNLESNFNKLVLLFDTGAPNGQNVIQNDNHNNGGITDGGPNALAGMTLETGFSANYFLSFTVGGGPETLYVDFARLGTEAQGGATRVLNPAGATVNPFDAQPCPAVTVDHDTASGSEIDGLYATVCGNDLYLLVTGNLQTNGNYLELFFDVGTTQIPKPNSVGQDRILPNNVTVGTAALQRMAENPADPANEPGLRFGADFFADYYVSFSNIGLPVNMFAIAATLSTGGAFVDNAGDMLEYGSFNGGEKDYPNPLSFDGQICVDPPFDTMACNPNGSGSFWNPGSDGGIAIQGDAELAANTLTPIDNIFSSYAPRLISLNPFDPFDRGTPAFPTPMPDPLPVAQLLQIAIDNANRGGVTGSEVAAAGQVATGVEVRVRLDELGWDGVSPIKITGWINGQNHDFLSNQLIGGTLDPGAPNLGEPRIVDFQFNVPGTGPWYVEIDPGTCASAATGACCFGSANDSPCAVMSVAQCGASGVGGTYKGNGSVCDPVPCGVIVSNIACCKQGDCFVASSPTDCTNQGGTPQTGFETCTGVNCPKGVCCYGSSCISGASALTCTNALLNPTNTEKAKVAFVFPNSTCNLLGAPHDGGPRNYLTPCCKSDYNKTGSRTVQDLFDYLADWFAKTRGADINSPAPSAGASVTVQDLFDFLAAWFAGGCTQTP